MYYNKRSHCNEKTRHSNEEQPLLTTTREIMCTTTKTQHSKGEKKKKKKRNYKLSLKPSHASLDSEELKSLCLFNTFSFFRFQMKWPFLQPAPNITACCFPSPHPSSRGHFCLCNYFPSWTVGSERVGYAHLIHCLHPIPSSQLSTLVHAQYLVNKWTKMRMSWDLEIHEGEWDWGPAAEKKWLMMHNPVPWMLVNGEPTMPRAMNALFNQVDVGLSPSFALHFLDHLRSWPIKGWRGYFPHLSGDLTENCLESTYCHVRQIIRAPYVFLLLKLFREIGLTVTEALAGPVSAPTPTCRELLQFKGQKTKTRTHDLILKWARGLNRYSPKTAYKRPVGMKKVLNISNR